MGLAKYELVLITLVVFLVDDLFGSFWVRLVVRSSSLL